MDMVLLACRLIDRWIVLILTHLEENGHGAGDYVRDTPFRKLTALDKVNWSHGPGRNRGGFPAIPVENIGCAGLYTMMIASSFLVVILVGVSE